MEQIVGLNPNNFGARYQLATLYEYQEDYERAIGAYKSLLQQGKEGIDDEGALP